MEKNLKRQKIIENNGSSSAVQYVMNKKQYVPLRTYAVVRNKAH